MLMWSGSTMCRSALGDLSSTASPWSVLTSTFLSLRKIVVDLYEVPAVTTALSTSTLATAVDSTSRKYWLEDVRSMTWN